MSEHIYIFQKIHWLKTKGICNMLLDAKQNINNHINCYDVLDILHRVYHLYMHFTVFYSLSIV